MRRGLSLARRAIVSVPFVALFWGILLSCSASERPPVVDQGPLPKGVLARVGGYLIHTETVANIAAHQKVDMQRARDSAVYDALFAAGARAAAPREARSAAARVLSRALVRQLWRDARSRPINDDELAEATATQFVDLDRPPGWRVAQFVVRTFKRYSAEKRRRAQKLAHAIYEQVLPIAAAAVDVPAPYRPEPARFNIATAGRKVDPIVDRLEKAVKAVDPKGLQVVVNEQAVIALDGRYIDYGRIGQGVVAEFAAMLPPLKQRGDITGVVHTQFGYQVVLLLERTAAKKVPRAERVNKLRKRIHFARARRAQTQLLKTLSARAGVEIQPNADALLAQLRLSFDDGADAQ